MNYFFLFSLSSSSRFLQILSEKEMNFDLLQCSNDIPTLSETKEESYRTARRTRKIVKLFISVKWVFTIRKHCHRHIVSLSADQNLYWKVKFFFFRRFLVRMKFVHFWHLKFQSKENATVGGRFWSNSSAIITEPNMKLLICEWSKLV